MHCSIFAFTTKSQNQFWFCVSVVAFLIMRFHNFDSALFCSCVYTNLILQISTYYLIDGRAHSLWALNASLTELWNVHRQIYLLWKRDEQSVSLCTGYSCRVIVLAPVANNVYVYTIYLDWRQGAPIWSLIISIYWSPLCIDAVSGAFHRDESWDL